VKLNTQKRNDIYNAVLAGGIDPKGTCAILSGASITTVTHVPSQSQFNLQYSADCYSVRAQIGTDQVGDWQDVYGWKTVIDRVRDWARRVDEWVDQTEADQSIPDLWSMLENHEDLTEQLLDPTDNAPFTEEEQEVVASQLEIIREQVRTGFGLTSEQINDVISRIDEAEAASRRMGRKDWLLLFAGTILTMILTPVIPPGVCLHILNLTIHAIRHLFLGGGGVKAIGAAH
jgi:hypothetical protein